MCHGRQLEPEHFPAHIISPEGGTNGIMPDRQSEKDMIADALRRHQGNRNRVAEELGVHRTTLWRKIKSYGITA